MVRKDKYFKVLGIKPTTDQKIIKKAYRRQALKFHPDKNNSPDAHYQFILITDAYEILTGQKRIKSTKKPNYRPKTREEILAEKVKRAKERYQRQQEEELEKDQAYFQKIAFGWRWRIFQVFAIYTALFSTLLSLDYYLDGEQVCVTQDAYQRTYDRVLEVRNESFTIKSDEYWFGPANNAPIRGNYSYLFHDLKSVSVVTNYIPITQQNSHSFKLNDYDYFENWTTFAAMSTSSVYGAFPFLHIMFFVPLMLLVFKRPNLRFSIWRLVSIWIIFPTIIFFTFSNDRIFYLYSVIMNN